MSVREEHDIDRVLLADVERGTGQLGQAAVFAGRREGRIGQPPKPAVLDGRCRSPD
jgi:hypothetical protein